MGKRRKSDFRVNQRKTMEIVVGQKINNWQIIEIKSPKSMIALCLLCKETTRRLYHSDLETIQSCGCQNTSIRKLIQKNAIFGSWIILSDQIDNQKALCKCVCGKETLISYRLVATGKSTSCGCQRKASKNMVIGQIFGYWRVEKILEDKNVIVFCTGCNQVTKKIPAYWLIRSRSRSSSCGCKSTEIYENSIQDRYGVKNPSKSPMIRAKIEETNLQTYGFKCSLSHPLSKQKTKATMLSRYGVENPTQLPENSKKLQIWCEANPNKLFISKPELEVLAFIQQYYPSAKKIKKEGYELDIFIPELNLGIEHNGLYHHSSLFKKKSYHLEKTKYFSNLGIRTIHIWGSEWKEKQEQVKSFLLSALDKNEHRIGARKCNIVWSNDKAEIFKAHKLLETTHIQGKPQGTKYVSNVYFNEELLATATFGKHLRNSREWVLTRFTTKTNHTISGILSKISRLASKELDSDIISWADYRLSEGKGYIKAGWIKEKIHPIDYFYYNIKSRKIVSKQSRQKNLVKTPEGMTEREHAKLDGLIEVYDCGKIKFKYKRHPNL